jgi:RHS repeat-associated protein
VPRTVSEVIVITYAYNTNGQLRSTTYPSGNTIAYTYGDPSSANPGKVIGIMLNRTGYTNTATGGSTPTGGVNLITNSDYKPFGPNWGWDWGNSCDTNNLATCTTSSTPRINQHLRQFDLDYRPITIASDPEGYNRLINWDRANRITSLNVPSGITIPGLSNSQSVNQAFGYDALDRLTNFTPGVTGATTLATGLALLPKEDFTYDAIGNRLSRATTAPNSSTAQTANYSYPNTTATPAANRRHILNSIAGAQTNAYTYDASGNTLTESAAQSTMNPATGQLNAAGVTQALAYTYDAKNRLSRAQIGANTADFITYKINALGQRVQKTGAGLYAFNSSLTIDTATGQSPLARTINFNARYVYDESGRLIGEYAPDGKLISETVYFNDLPIATLRPKGANAGTPLGQSGTTTGNPSNGATAANANNVGNNSTTNRVNVEIFYVHADHLGTPRTVTRSTVATGANAPSSANATSPGAINKAVWMWNSDPFGTTGTTGAGGSANSAPNKNPQNITGTAAQIAAGTFEQNLRMPGQVEDQETKKFYNYFRDYDPTIGRYTTSDPIGLKAGNNTYGYVEQNPIKYTDPFGLVKWRGNAAVAAVMKSVGRAFGRYDLVSECVRGMQWEVVVEASGWSAAFSPPTVGGGVSPIEFDDYLDYVNPYVFNGAWRVAGSVFAAGSIGFSRSATLLGQAWSGYGKSEYIG